jgi:hypothetical protein
MAMAANPRAHQLARAEDQILPQLREVLSAPNLLVTLGAIAPALGVDRRAVAKASARFSLRGLACHAPRHELAGGHLDMEGELVVHLAFDRAVPEPSFRLQPPPRGRGRCCLVC